MDRRQFLVRSSLVVGAAAFLPSLLPTCKECGDRLLIELLAGDIDLCRSCRSTHIQIYQSSDIPRYNTIASLQDLFRKTQNGMRQALKETTPELSWLRQYPGATASVLLPSVGHAIPLIIAA